MDALWLAPVFMLAAFIQGAVGFGFGMVCMGLLPLFIPVSEAVVTAVLLAAVNNVVLFWRLRHSLRLVHIGPLLLGALMGAPLGIFALKHLDSRWIVLVVSLSIVAYSTWALRERTAPKAHGHPWLGVPVGVLSGCFGGAAATGGPPVVMFAAWRALSKEVAAATIQALLLALAFMQVGGYLIADLLTPTALERAGWALPAIAVGLASGQLVFRRLSGPGFRTATLVGLLVLGLGLLVRLVTTWPR